jgi:dihydropyrimidine dehydrogenase (NAD+) subunit PreA
MEGPSANEWRATAASLQEAGVDMIEMNVSCAHGMPERYRGSFINDDAELLEEVVRACKTGTDLPVIVKLNALSRDLGAAVRACVRAEADGIASTNTLLAIPSVDVHRAVPNVPASISGDSTVMGYSGSGIRPFGLKSVAEIAGTCSLPLSGVGGIDTWENCVEYLMLGASTIQICTAAMLHGLGIINDLRAGLENFLFERGNMRLSALRGQALPFLASPERVLASSEVAKADVRHALCTLCSKCIEPCVHAATAAIRLEHGRLSIDEEKCIGCGLCIAICPFDALELRLSNLVES